MSPAVWKLSIITFLFIFAAEPRRFALQREIQKTILQVQYPFNGGEENGAHGRFVGEGVELTNENIATEELGDNNFYEAKEEVSDGQANLQMGDNEEDDNDEGGSGDMGVQKGVVDTKTGEVCDDRVSIKVEDEDNVDADQGEVSDGQANLQREADKEDDNDKSYEAEGGSYHSTPTEVWSSFSSGTRFKSTPKGKIIKFRGLDILCTRANYEDTAEKIRKLDQILGRLHNIYIFNL